METRMQKTGQVCFWIGFVIEAILVMVDKSAYINPYEGWLFRLTFLLFCIKVATTKYNKKEWICMFTVGIIAMISYFVNEKDEVVRTVVFIMACKDINLKKQLWTVCGITAVGTGIIFVLSILGIYGTLTMTANFGRGPFPGIVETRYCFGMGHPNAFQCMILMMTILILYCVAEKMKWYHFILILLFNYILYRYTDSNTSFLIAVAIMAGIVLLKYVQILRNAKVIYWLSALLMIGIVVFSIIGSHTGRDTPIMYHIDQVLNGRFQYANVVENARVENWTLFGLPDNTEFFDSGFIRLAYWYGIIPGLLYVLSNLYLVYQSYKHKDYPLLVIMVGMTLYMLMEAHFISHYILRNYIFIWLGYYWYQDIKKGKEIYFWQVKQWIS